MEELVDAVNELQAAVERVEVAVRDSGSSSWVSPIGWIVVIFFVLTLPGKVWHSKWRYQMQYELAANQIQMGKEPHDCDFFAAPIGMKYCSYERVVSTVEWSRSTSGGAIASYDNGKTWQPFTPDAGSVVPQSPSVHNVFVNWKKDDE